MYALSYNDNFVGTVVFCGGSAMRDSNLRVRGIMIQWILELKLNKACLKAQVMPCSL